jgi:hypothetical protein
MHLFPLIEKPRASADAGVHAEYHRLALQQLERYKLTIQYGRLPDSVKSIINEKLTRHRLSVKYYASRAKFTHPAPASAPAVGLASKLASRMHQFTRSGNAAASASFN